MKRFLLFLFVLHFPLHGKVVLISDIDDTIKQSNTQSFTECISYLLKNKSFPHLSSIYQDLNQAYGEVDFFYVSLSYPLFYRAKEFVSEHNFPKGEYFQRSLSSPSPYQFKFKTIAKIIDRYDLTQTEFIFFGDNVKKDAQVYREISEQYQLNSQIYIRDIRLTQVKLTKLLSYTPPSDDIVYFISEAELLESPLTEALSEKTLQDIRQGVIKQKILPEYIVEQLRKRLSRTHCRNRKLFQKKTVLSPSSCEDSMKALNDRIWQEYYLQF